MFRSPSAVRAPGKLLSCSPAGTLEYPKNLKPPADHHDN